MRDSSRIRVCIALVAAYVIALQALLLTLSVVAASPFTSNLCTSAAHSGDHGPVSPSGCPCAGSCGAQCCAHALAVPTPVVTGSRQPHDGAIVPEARLAGVVRPATHRPHIPRAPPLV